MPRVTFYFGAADRLTAAADWLGRRSANAQRIVVVGSDPRQIDTLDQVLWTRSALSFTPHCRASSALAMETPIVLASDVGEVGNIACLLNLTNDLPACHDQLDELFEMISYDENERSAARNRFRAYRDLGYPIESIDLAGRNMQ